MVKKFVFAVIIVALLDSLIVFVAVSTGKIKLINWVLISFIGLIIYSYLQIYLPYKKKLAVESVPLMPNMDTSEIDFSSFKPISSNQILSSLVIPNNSYFFDPNYIYQVGESGFLKVKISDITEIGKTGTRLTNRYVWFVKANHEGAVVTFRFTHNYTLWNHNFTDFLDLVRKVNPNAKVVNFSIWTM